MSGLEKNPADFTENLDWHRTNYGVDAKVGGRIEYTGNRGRTQLGTIIGGSGPYLCVRLDGDEFSGRFHPTWEINYLDATMEPRP